MKIFIYILMALAVGIIAYNATILDFNNLIKGDSAIALIGVLAGCCVLVLLGILLISKAIAKKAENQ